MLASISTLAGVLLAVIVLTIFRRRATPGATSKPSAPGWFALAFGILAAAALFIGLSQRPESGNSQLLPNLVSIALAAAAVVTSIATLLKLDRSWQVWAGLATGLVPAVFWIVFALGYILGGA